MNSTKQPGTYETVAWLARQMEASRGVDRLSSSWNAMDCSSVSPHSWEVPLCHLVLVVWGVPHYTSGVGWMGVTASLHQ